jgi:hypothetical protein
MSNASRPDFVKLAKTSTARAHITQTILSRCSATTVGS